MFPKLKLCRASFYSFFNFIKEKWCYAFKGVICVERIPKYPWKEFLILRKAPKVDKLQWYERQDKIETKQKNMRLRCKQKRLQVTGPFPLRFC